MPSKHFVPGVFAAALLSSGAAFALAPSGAEVSVSPAGKASNMAMASDGRYAVSYTRASSVLLQRYNANGSANGAAITIFAGAGDQQLLTDVAAGPGGKYVVAWWEVGSNDRVRVQAVNADGSLIGSGDVVAETAATRPALAYRADGSFLVAYDQAANLYVQPYNADGSRNGSRIEVATSSDLDLEADLAADATGNFTVVWTGQRGGDFRALLRQFSASGAPLGSEAVVSYRYHEAIGASQPQLAMRPDGRFVVLWDEGGNPGSAPADADARSSGETIMRLYQADGMPLDVSVLISDHTLTSRSPAVSIDAQGDFVVATESRPYPVDGSGAGGDSFGSSIEIRRFNVDGVARGQKLRVNTTTAGNQYYPAVAVTKQGDMVVSWDDVGAGKVKLQRFVTDPLTARLGISTTGGTTYSTAVPGGPAGTYSFTAGFCNNASDHATISGITSRTIQLTNGNVLLNRTRDGSPVAGGAGSELDVAIVSTEPALPSNLLYAGRCVNQLYQIGLANRSRFTFKIDLFGDAGLPNP